MGQREGGPPGEITVTDGAVQRRQAGDGRRRGGGVTRASRVHRDAVDQPAWWNTNEGGAHADEASEGVSKVGVLTKQQRTIIRGTVW